MPSIRRMVMSGLCLKMNRKKKYEETETPLRRCLTTLDMTLLGVGHMVGAGIYVLTGSVAKSIAGPGVILSFFIAGVASLLAALCYAEFGACIPRAGSAYIYTYVSIGEFWAFIIGWNIILEHMIGAASVARTWSGYVDSLSGGVFTNVTNNFLSITQTDGYFSQSPDFLASSLCIVYALLLALGVKTSTRLNSLLTFTNMSIIVFVIGIGAKYVDIDNWTDASHGGFMPYGYAGVLAGAASCFYAFIGFDSIASCGEEAREPSKSIPLATIISMGVVTISYILLSGILTLIIPYYEINPSAALPEAFASIGITWAKYIISIGALCGMTTTLFGSLFSLPRVMYAMASDGLLFSCFANVNQRTQLPMINLAVSGVLTAIIACLFDLQHLVEFMSIGTFLAYTIVSTSIIILRYKPNNYLSKSQVNLKSSVVNVNEGAHHHSDSDESPANSDITISSTESSLSHQSHVSEFDLLQNTTGKLKKKYVKWIGFLANLQNGTAVTVSVIIYIIGCICLSILNALPSIWWSDFVYIIYYILYFHVLLTVVVCVLIIAAHEQAPPTNKFQVPWVPLLPALSIYINILLISHFKLITWLRFFIWMFIGVFIYFSYGIHHSKESNEAYSVLMTSFEKEKEEKTKIKNTELKFYENNSDKVPILSQQ